DPLRPLRLYVCTRRRLDPAPSWTSHPPFSVTPGLAKPRYAAAESISPALVSGVYRKELRSMGNQKANLHTYMEDAAGAVPVRKDRSKEFNQGMQDGADHALELVRLSLGRPGGMECLDEYRRSVSTHEDDNDYRAGVSHGVELMQAKLADYVQEYGPRKSR